MASTYLSYTQGTPTNNLKWTVSMWVKRSEVLDTGAQYLLTAYVDGSNHWVMRFIEDKIDIYDYVSGSQSGKLRTNSVFRDPAAWYHIVYVYDSANASATDRMRLYVNGVEETSFTTDTQPAQDTACIFNLSGRIGELGRRSDGGAETYFDGSMAHVHFCDGQAYAASDFGETDSTSGIWVAKTSPSVTYGNNGFFLKYQDTSAFGDDSSGNTNDFTVSGTMTQTKDTPDNNFCTMNPLDNYLQSMEFSNGNNTIVTDYASPATATIGVNSGKWYWECKAVASSGTAFLTGIRSTQVTDQNAENGYRANDWSYYGTDGNYRNDDSGTSYGDTYGVGDIIGVALDLTNNKLYFSKNGTWQNSGDPTSGATGTGAISITAVASTPLGAYFPAAGGWSSSVDYTWSMNFGNGYFGTTAVSTSESDDAGIGSFEYDVPAGYYALCTTNLGDQS